HSRVLHSFPTRRSSDLCSETVPEKCRVGWFGRRRGTVRKRSGPDECVSAVSSWGTAWHARTRSARATRGSRGTRDDKDDHAYDLDRKSTRLNSSHVSIS